MLGYVKIEIQTRDKDIQISDRHIYTSRGLVLVRKRQIKVSAVKRLYQRLQAKWTEERVYDKKARDRRQSANK
ncbi:hypothetical protein SUGI_1154590 [Cryptomeria japonica]|nr:hypothetical protein SUGI_1154590 [Cryptomeria japonica]